MVNFRDAVPPTNPADMAVLAARMNLYRPVSLRKLIGDLGPPTAVMFSSGNISTSIAGGNVAGSATWILNSQGFWNFQGSINNSSLVSLHFGFGMALNVKDANGNPLGVIQADSIGPALPLFSNNASWNQTGYDQRIVDLWPAVFGARISPPTTICGRSLMQVISPKQLSKASELG